MEIRNILWHVNGTLFDTNPAITYALSKALNGMGFSVALNVIDALVRQSFDDCVETLSGRFKLDRSLLRQQFSEFYRTISPANQLPFPGARDVCEFIHQNGGVNIAVTDGSLEFALKLLEAHQFSPLIDDVFSAEQAFPSMSAPSILLAVLEKHALNSTETLLIGSRNIDVQAGQSVGVRACLLGRAELTAPADIRIESHSQLLDFLVGEAESRQS